jgi:maltose O-acetyltransferase
VTDAEDRRSQRDRMLAGDLYLADDPELAAMSLRARELQDRFNRTDAAASVERWDLLVELVGSVGAGTEIRPPFHCDYGSHLSLGERVFANFGLVALDVAPITIGDDVQIGPNPSPSGPTPGSVAAPSCWPASRWGRTRWSVPAPSSPGTCPREPSSWATPPG